MSLVSCEPPLSFNSVSAPSDVKATDGTFDDFVRVSWQTVVNADKYYILYEHCK